MPISTMKLAPGVNSQITPAQGMAQIISADLIRFKAAGNEILPEKLGGWSRFYPVALGSTPRDLHAWEGLNADTWLAAGCEEELTVIGEGVAEDVTPQTYQSTIAPSFTTAVGDTEVSIDDTNITANIYDSIFILVQVSIGGIVLFGSYPIETVLDADSYTVVAASAAGSTAGPGGAVPAFTTVSGNAGVSVALADHGYAVGDIFPALMPTTVGGITIYGAYLVQTVVDADNFTITASEEATSSTSGDMNGGDTEIIYYISGAPAPSATGYGVGGYGDGGYGTGTSIPSSAGTPITATNWSLDNWGEVLIATPKNGPIYTWSPDGGFPLATKIVDAPLINGGAFVAQPTQILVAWASSAEGVQDPLSLNWSDAGNYNEWAVSSQTQAGGFRLPTGSKIVGGFSGPNFQVIWTDIEVWAMDYLGPPLIFGFNQLAAGCGLISQHGYAVLNSTVYWMGYHNFFSLSGETVQTIPCSVWDYVFQDIDESASALAKIYVGANSLFSEILFFYPSASGGTGEIDSYAKFNPPLNTWDCGRLARSAWIDQSPVGPPVGAMPSGLLQQHEIAEDDDGQPMMPSLSTGFFQIADGDEFQFIDWLFPDMKWGYIEGAQSASISITLRYKEYPNGTEYTAGPFTVTSATEFVNMRLRGRFVAVDISSSDLGTWWRLGGLKFRSAPDGRR